MPMNITVGLTRKSSHNYQSEGASINISAELDSSLLTDPPRLQREIASLYHEAENALEQQLAAPQQQQAPQAKEAPVKAPSYNRKRNGATRGATEAQIKAIYSITRTLNLDPEGEAVNCCGQGLDLLSVRQASALIDHLKAIQGAGARV